MSSSITSSTLSVTNISQEDPGETVDVPCLRSSGSRDINFVCASACGYVVDYPDVGQFDNSQATIPVKSYTLRFTVQRIIAAAYVTTLYQPELSEFSVLNNLAENLNHGLSTQSAKLDRSHALSASPWIGGSTASEDPPQSTSPSSTKPTQAQKSATPTYSLEYSFHQPPKACLPNPLKSGAVASSPDENADMFSGAHSVTASARWRNS